MGGCAVPQLVAEPSGRPPLLREFCAENVELVPAALAAGARRIELCDNLAVGGTTPSLGVIRAAAALAHASNATVMCMIRPRGGNFVYTPEEVAIMHDDLLAAKREGVDGVVFGCLTAEGQLDQELITELATLAHEPSPEAPKGIAVTFHMAFDALAEKDQLAAIDWLASQGIDRILTHGGPAGTPIADNIGRIQAFIERASGRLTILPGGGITWENVEAIAATLNVREVHGTKIVRLG